MHYTEPFPVQNIEIVYRDDTLLVVNKPAELLSVPGRGPDKQDSVINRLKAVYPNARIVHRLDMSTSGIMIIPLSHEAERNLSKQFQARLVHKEYVAEVLGSPEPAQGDITLPLICDWPNRPKQKVDIDNGKPSHTLYQVVTQRNENNLCISRVILKPITGRSHQLRVHMLALGHPILGDNLYATPQALALAPRLLLHAQAIRFQHPQTGAEIHVESPPPF